MRIAFIALHFSEYSVSLARELAKTHEVLLILSEPNFMNEVGDIRYLQDVSGLECMLLPHRPSFSVLLGNAWKIIARVREFKPDVMHLQEEPKDYLLAALPFLGKCPVVLTVHDPKPHAGTDLRKISYTRRSLYLRLLRKRAAAIIVHGDYLCRASSEVFSLAQNRIYSIPHGPLGKIFGAELDFGWRPGCCLFFGRIEEYKGLGHFIESMRLLHSRGIYVKGVIAGRGADLDRFREEIQASPFLELRDRYLSVKEVLSAFAEANVVVMPYHEATQSGVSAYAIGLGRPVVATRVGGLPESVLHEETGFLVEKGNVEELSAAVARVVEDPELAKRMSKAAFDFGNSQVSWGQIAEMTSRVYVEMFSRNDRR